MPRFNFSSYVVRTDFNSYYDLDPQNEWEAKNRDQDARASFEVSSSEEEVFQEIKAYKPQKIVSDEVDVLESLSETSRIIEKVVTATPENVFSAFRSVSPELKPKQKSPSDQQNVETSFFKSALDLDESLFEVDITEARSSVSYTPTAENPNQQVTPPTQQTATNFQMPPSTVPLYTVEHTAVSPTQFNKRLITSPVSDYTSGGGNTSQRESAVSSPTTNIDLLYPGGKPILMLTLDERDTLQPIRTRDEVNEILRAVQGNDLPPPHENVAEAIGKFQRTPIKELSHFSTVGQFFGNLRENPSTCDVNFRIGSRIYSAHRIALACFSDYFANLFFRKEDKKQSIPIGINLKGIEPKSFQIFLDFVYTGQIIITPDVISDIYVMAELLRIPKLKTKCADFVDHMSLERAIVMLRNGQLNPESNLFQCVVSGVAEEFVRASKHIAFLDLDVDTLCFILSQDHLTIESEMEVFIAGLNWIAQAFNERKQYIERVMECVRFPHITQEELFGCMQVTDFFKNNKKCEEMILKANWIISARKMGIDDPMNFPVPDPRQCLSPTYRRKSDMLFSAHSFLGSDIAVAVDPDEISSGRSTPVNERTPRSIDIFAVGEFNENSKVKPNKPTGFFERYVTSENQWEHQTNLPERRCHYAVTTMSTKLYLTGGYNPENIKKKTPIPLKDAFILNTETNKWTQIAPMNTARMHHSMCYLYGMVYAVGGQDEKERVLESVECYNPMTNNWFYVKSMPTARLGTGVAVKNGRIYVAGGYGDTVDKKSGMPVLGTVEAYNPRTNTWDKLNDLRFPRCHVSMVTVNGELFICGGATRSYTFEDSVLTSVPAIDIYIEESDVWEHITDMKIPRHNAGATVVEGKIYLIGGHSTTTNTMLNSIECYNVRNDEWVDGVQELPYPGEWLQCVAIPSRK